MRLPESYPAARFCQLDFEKSGAVLPFLTFPSIALLQPAFVHTFLVPFRCALTVLHSKIQSPPHAFASGYRGDALRSDGKLPGRKRDESGPACLANVQASSRSTPLSRCGLPFVAADVLLSADAWVVLVTYAQGVEAQPRQITKRQGEPGGALFCRPAAKLSAL